MTTLTVLRKMRKLLTPRKNWTQFASARDRLGDYCQAEDQRAVCFCLGGSHSKIEGIYNTSAEVLAALRFNNWCDVASWNDHPRRTHAQVLARIDAAIRRVQRTTKRKEKR